MKTLLSEFIDFEMELVTWLSEVSLLGQLMSLEDKVKQSPKLEHITFLHMIDLRRLVQSALPDVLISKLRLSPFFYVTWLILAHNTKVEQFGSFVRFFNKDIHWDEIVDRHLNCMEHLDRFSDLFRKLQFFAIAYHILLQILT